MVQYAARVTRARNVRQEYLASTQTLMAPSTPTGLLVLAMLIGQAAGFAKAPKDKDAADKGGDVRASRIDMGTPCVGLDQWMWRDSWGDGCD